MPPAVAGFTETVLCFDSSYMLKPYTCSVSDFCHTLRVALLFRVPMHALSFNQLFEVLGGRSHLPVRVFLCPRSFLILYFPFPSDLLTKRCPSAPSYTSPFLEVLPPFAPSIVIEPKGKCGSSSACIQLPPRFFLVPSENLIPYLPVKQLLKLVK